MGRYLRLADQANSVEAPQSVSSVSSAAHPRAYDKNDLNDKRGRVGPCRPESPSERINANAQRWSEAAAAVAWFLRSEPPSEPFVLRRNPMGQPFVTVLHPARYWRALRADLAAGPGRGRDTYGAVKADVLRLYELFGGGK